MALQCATHSPHNCSFYKYCTYLPVVRTLLTACETDGVPHRTRYRRDCNSNIINTFQLLFSYSLISRPILCSPLIFKRIAKRAFSNHHNYVVWRSIHANMPSCNNRRVNMAAFDSRYSQSAAIAFQSQPIAQMWCVRAPYRSGPPHTHAIVFCHAFACKASIRFMSHVSFMIPSTAWRMCTSGA